MWMSQADVWFRESTNSAPESPDSSCLATSLYGDVLTTRSDNYPCSWPVFSVHDLATCGGNRRDRCRNAHV